MKPIIPAEALQNHTAILGMTGSGKTSTAKLAVEQVVAQGARVCILDPIKSDWWGLTSSADGKKPGLPFQILGGPRGHVPLHAGAGKPIGELVASGALPLSIIDMADFEAGGQSKFFTDFAHRLQQKMRGVLYLVMEEAHEFAPKERAGFEKENMALHYAKRLAVAGRSKGIRLIVLTQSTQSLHNALLGSCQTVIAHNFTAPAQQEPVIKWLKANVPADVAKQVEGSMSSLDTGEGWICCGKAKIYERRQFPRIHTYDNSATPTDDDHQHEVKTAPVDTEKLRSIVGEAVQEAEANDPKKLKATIANLQAELKKKPGVELTDAQIETFRQQGEQRGYVRGRDDILRQFGALVEQADLSCRSASAHADDAHNQMDAMRRTLAAAPKAAPSPSPSRSQARVDRPVSSPEGSRAGGDGAASGSLAKAERLILSALAQYPDGRTSVQVAVLTGYAHGGGGFRNAIGALRTTGRLEGGNERLLITQAGMDALGTYTPLPTGRALLEHWMRQLPKAECKSLEAIANAYPRSLSPQQVANIAGYEAEGGGFRNALGRLRTLELIKGTREIKASEELFDG